MKSYQSILPNKNVESELLTFLSDRLYTYWTKTLGLRVDIVKAVLSDGLNQPLDDLLQRCYALDKFIQSEDASVLIQGFKRVSNILKGDGPHILKTYEVNSALFAEQQEKNLYVAIANQKDNLDNLLLENRYEELLSNLTQLKQPVDEFFEKVMVNVDDENLKNNRLCMLAKLQSMFKKFADLSLIQES